MSLQEKEYPCIFKNITTYICICTAHMCIHMQVHFVVHMKEIIAVHLVVFVLGLMNYVMGVASVLMEKMSRIAVCNFLQNLLNMHTYVHAYTYVT